MDRTGAQGGATLLIGDDASHENIERLAQEIQVMRTDDIALLRELWRSD